MSRIIVRQIKELSEQLGTAERAAVGIHLIADGVSEQERVEGHGRTLEQLTNGVIRQLWTLVEIHSILRDAKR